MLRDDGERPLLLVIRTGLREIREYLLKSICQRYRVHMFLGVEPEWELEYVSGWTRMTDTLDAEVLVAEARKLHARDPIAGVLCWDESRIAQAARVAAALGLPGPAPEAVDRCRDKHLTRLALATAGVPQPASVVVASEADALAAAGRIGYPVVLKPTDLAFSMGVVTAADAEELAARYPFTAGVQGGLPDYRATVLIEEYVPGEEISVDSAVCGGTVLPLVLARKRLGYPPYCVEVGHCVDAADPLLHEPGIVAVLRDAHAALGFTDGITHTELKLSPAGPKVIEVNGRLGGGLIPYLGLRATGIDTGLAAADVACGKPPVITRDRTLVAGIRFFFAEADDTVIDSIRFEERELPDAIEQALVFARPGDVKSPPPKGTVNGRLALAIAVTGSVDACQAALDAAAGALRIVAR